MTPEQRADVKLLDKALDDIIHDRCANCRKPAPREASLCNSCWERAAAQLLTELHVSSIRHAN